MRRAKAHPCMWGSRADLSGLTQQSSSCSLECYLEEVHTGSGRKVSGNIVHNNSLSMRQNKGCIEGFWPGLPDPRNLKNILHFNRLCKKQWDKLYMMGKSLTEEDISQISEENLFLFFFPARGSAAALSISKVIPHQRTTKTLNHASCSTFHVDLTIVPHLLIRCPLVN